MKQFVIAGTFAIAGLVLPGSLSWAQQTAPPTGEPMVGGTPTGTSGRTETDRSSRRAKSARVTADAAFVKTAAEGRMAEVELGKLATEKAASDDVKKFGQRMVDDHGKANDQLKDVASKKSITLPSELSAKDRATKARLEKLSGEAFDRAYMSDMVKDHTKDVSEFRREAASGSDPDVKSFASSTLPTLESHLKDAKSVDATVMKSPKPTKAEGKARKEGKQ